MRAVMLVLHLHGTHLFAPVPVLMLASACLRASSFYVHFMRVGGKLGGSYSGQLPRGLCMGRF